MPCKKCNGTGFISYYFDGGDHFGAGPAHNSRWRKEPCECQKDNRKENRMDTMELYEMPINHVLGREVLFKNPHTGRKIKGTIYSISEKYIQVKDRKQVLHYTKVEEVEFVD